MTVNKVSKYNIRTDLALCSIAVKLPGASDPLYEEYHGLIRMRPKQSKTNSVADPMVLRWLCVI